MTHLSVHHALTGIIGGAMLLAASISPAGAQDDGVAGVKRALQTTLMTSGKIILQNSRGNGQPPNGFAMIRTVTSVSEDGRCVTILHTVAPLSTVKAANHYRINWAEILTVDTPKNQIMVFRAKHMASDETGELVLPTAAAAQRVANMFRFLRDQCRVSG